MNNMTTQSDPEHERQIKETRDILRECEEAYGPDEPKGRVWQLKQLWREFVEFRRRASSRRGNLHR